MLAKLWKIVFIMGHGVNVSYEVLFYSHLWNVNILF